VRVKLAVVDPAVLHYIPHRQTARQTERPRYFCSSRPHWYLQCTVMVKLAVVDPAVLHYIPHRQTDRQTTLLL